MKKITIYLFVAISALVFSSCSQDFLEKEPPLNISEGDIFSSPDRIEATVLGLYAQLKNTGTESFMGGKSYVVFDARGDDFRNISNNNVVLFGTYNMQTGDNDDENTVNWEQAYLAINDANVFLASLEKSKSVAGSKYEQYKSEALFVRAFAYYYLNMLYGLPYAVNPDAKSVPLRLVAETTIGDNDLKRSTVKEVFQQILTDVSTESLANLPDGVNTYDGATRATKAAAHMLRMRVYMAMQDWDNAITEGKAITGYSLVGDISSLFATPFYSTENIFSFPMTDTDAPNTQESVGEYYYDAQIMVLDNAHGITSKSGYNNSADARISKLTQKLSGQTILTKAKVKTDWVPIFRYSETLLNLAECYVEKGGTDNENIAKGYLKQVRRRSLPDASDLVLSNSQIDALSGADLKTAVYNERRLEFLGEAIRDLDIHRRGANYDKPSVGAHGLLLTPADDGYIWPIPASETSTNKELNN